MGQQQEMVAGSNPLLRRVVLALSLVATLLAAMAVEVAGSAQAKEDAPCISDQVSFSRCAGGSGSKGGGGEGKVRADNGGTTSTVGGRNFRDTGIFC